MDSWKFPALNGILTKINLYILDSCRAAILSQLSSQLLVSMTEEEKMSVEEKLGLTMMMEIIEGELEERKDSNDRRQKNCVDSMKQVSDDERRTKIDRRLESA